MAFVMTILALFIGIVLPSVNAQAQAPAPAPAPSPSSDGTLLPFPHCLLLLFVTIIYMLYC